MQGNYFRDPLRLATQKRIAKRAIANAIPTPRRAAPEKADPSDGSEAGPPGGVAGGVSVGGMVGVWVSTGVSVGACVGAGERP